MSAGSFRILTDPFAIYENVRGDVDDIRREPWDNASLTARLIFERKQGVAGRVVIVHCTRKSSFHATSIQTKCRRTKPFIDQIACERARAR